MKEVFIGIKIADSMQIRQLSLAFNGCQFTPSVNMIDLETREI